MTTDQMTHNSLEPDGWNKAETLGRLGGDEGLLHELIQIFMEESPKLLQRMREAIAASDADAVMREAHNIKGETACLGGGSAATTAQQLEDMGRDHQLAGVAEAFSTLERQVSALKVALTQSSAAHS